MFNLPKNTPLGHLKLIDTFQFYDIPRLFSCKNNTNNYFIGLSTFDDFENYEWLYLPVSQDRLSTLISNKMYLIDGYKIPEDGYLYHINTDIDGNAKVKYLLPEQIDNNDLPGKEVYLTTEKIISPQQNLGVINANEAAQGSRRETLNIHLYPWDTNLPELDVRELGAVLTSFQELADALGQYNDSEPTLKGAIPAEILEKTKFRATQIFVGSFGIQLKSNLSSDLFNDSLASKVLFELTNLLESSNDEDKLSNKLHYLKGRVASKYRSFLKNISKINSPLKVHWGSPNLEIGRTIKLSQQEIKTAYEMVSKIDIDISESVTFKAELLGLDVSTKRYRVRHQDDNEDYTGKISEESINLVQHSEINGMYMVTLKKIIETNSSSGSEFTKWLLVDLKHLNQ